MESIFLQASVTRSPPNLLQTAFMDSSDPLKSMDYNFVSTRKNLFVHFKNEENSSQKKPLSIVWTFFKSLRNCRKTKQFSWQCVSTITLIQLYTYLYLFLVERTLSLTEILFLSLQLKRDRGVEISAQPLLAGFGRIGLRSTVTSLKV